MPTPNAPRQHGFTLLGLVVAIGIAAVLLMFAGSGLTAGAHAARAAESRSALLADLNRARMDAALQGAEVRLCPSGDGQGCTGGYRWESGWLAFLDHDGDGRVGPDDRILLRRPALPTGIGLITSSGRPVLTFQPNGGNAGSNITFTLCDGRGPEHATALVLNNRGDMRATTPSDARARQACVP